MTKSFNVKLFTQIKLLLSDMRGLQNRNIMISSIKPNKVFLRFANVLYCFTNLTKLQKRCANFCFLHKRCANFCFLKPFHQDIMENVVNRN